MKKRHTTGRPALCFLLAASEEQFYNTHHFTTYLSLYETALMQIMSYLKL